MNYRLGIDLGTSSLGWCCMELDNDNVKNILDIGVRIFPDGRTDKTKEPLCVSRRNARGQRRRLKRFKQRQKKLIEIMKKYGFLPTDNREFKKLELLNPYELRFKALHQQVSLYEIGRAIFHLNQRRGFLSNRKDEKDTKSSSKTKKAMDTLISKIEEQGCITLGEYMYKSGEFRFKNATDAKGKLVVDVYPNRAMYIHEFDKIWECQQKYYPNIMSDSVKEELRNTCIFYQRPLKKQETGFCSLEPDERRAPNSYMITQRFRIMTEVANLRIIHPEERGLNKEERISIQTLLDNAPLGMYDADYIVSFDKIISYLNLPSETIFNLMKGNRTGLLCNKTNAILNNKQTLEKYWSSITLKQQNEIIDVLCDYSLKREDIECFLEDIFSGISEDEINKTIEQSLLLPEGYSNLSSKAMEKLVEDMVLCGSDYSMAVENVYNKNLAENQFFAKQEIIPHYQELFVEQLIGGNKEIYNKQLDYDNYMGRITNVSVHIALNQLRQVVNEIISKYGHPNGITIELGRELTNGKEALAKIERRQKENADIILEAKSEMRKAGIPVTAFNIEKYKVWRNINPKDATKRIDVYTGKTINISDLFSKDYDIEHILPYSWTYDDSYDNKIITRANINRKKSNQLPYEFFNDKEQLRTIAKDDAELEAMHIDNIIARIKDVDKANGKIKKTFNQKAMAWRFSKNARDIFNRNNKNMKRDLTDMQYMSKLAKKYLTCICDYNKIVSAKGQMTDLLKKVWNISDTLPEDFRLWQSQKWQKDNLLEIKKENILKLNPDILDAEAERIAKDEIKELSDTEIHNLTFSKKDRSIHYHHALDAFTLANITPSIVQYISSEKLANEAEEYYNKKKQNDNEVTLSKAKEEILKQSSHIYGKPYSSFDKEELSQILQKITISYKQPIDRLKSNLKKSKILNKNLSQFSFGAINEDTAFGFKRILKIGKSDIDLELYVCKNGEKVYEKHSLSTMMPVFRTKEQKKDFLDQFTKWQQASVRKKFLNKDQYNEIEQSFIKTFTKDKAYKWYASAGNYGAQIYQINTKDKFFPNKNEDWSLEILSNFYAFERKGKFFWKDIYPTAKLITTLRINDIVEATFDREDDLESGFSKIKLWVKEQFKNNPDAKELKLLFRVKKMSGGSIFLRPLHIAQEDNGDVKSWQCKVGKFKQYKCKKVVITPTGKVLRG